MLFGVFLLTQHATEQAKLSRAAEKKNFQASAVRKIVFRALESDSAVSVIFEIEGESPFLLWVTVGKGLGKTGKISEPMAAYCGSSGSLLPQ